MPTFDSPFNLYQKAADLYNDARFFAAALTWARCSEAARTQGDLAFAFAAGVREADAWRMEGELRRALGLLLTLLSHVPPDALPDFVWLARKQHLRIQMELWPEITLLGGILTDLEVLADRQTHPVRDLYYLRGEIAFRRGEWELALVHFGRGWQHIDKDSQFGIRESLFPWRAVHCCLSVGRKTEATSWLQHLTTLADDEVDRARLKATTLLLSLEAGDRAAVTACVEDGSRWQTFWKTYELWGRLFLRGDSLDPLHDPSEPSHPARLLTRLVRSQSIHDRFQNLLALVDYRLSCIRFTAGLPAVDDLYYRHPDLLPVRITPADSDKLQRQLHHFRVSWRLLRILAERIDGLLQCDWRIRETESRRQRCESIVNACGVGVVASS